MRYLKKTDWGDYWRTESSISKASLIHRALAHVAQAGISLQTPPAGQPEKQIFSGSLTITRPANRDIVQPVGRHRPRRSRP